MSPRSALFDLNVVLDVTLARPEFEGDSAAALSLAEAGRIRGRIAAHSVTTFQYLLERDLGRAGSRKAVARLLDLLDVVPVDGDRLREAVGMNWRDFEDAVQTACAEAAGVDFIVTRDKKGFKDSTLRVVSPAEIVALLE